jgi:aspartate aminotransferase
MPQLAQRVGRAKPSAIMVIAEKAKQLKAAGRDIISFSIGVPNFLPGEHVYARRARRCSHDSGQYGSNRGADALLDAFLKHIEALGFTGYTRANLSIGIGAKQVLYNLAEALLNEGDEICFAAPYWTTYRDIADIVGAKVNVLPCGAEQNYKLTRRSSMRRWRASRKCSCSTTRPIPPAWSTRARKSPRWPMCW